MKFVDTAKFIIKAGDGGHGAVSFHRALFVPNGGPNGGDGGKGGDVIFLADSGKYSLLDLKYQKTYSAENGKKGDIKNMHGAAGEDKIVKVPVGTLILDIKTGEIIADLNEDQKRVVIAKGGKGGKGNARFANSRNKAPTIFEAGELGDELEVKAELKVLADVGFVGLPNAGKSTLLRALTNSKPEVSNYAFTTINPQLGVCKDNDDSTFVIADLPGLIEGASLGKGLGHEFLKHIERCKVICHVIDMSGNFGQENIIENYNLIRKELINYNFKLDERPEIIVANKMDLEESKINLLFEENKEFFKDKNVVFVSGLKKENIVELIGKISDELKFAKDTPLWDMKVETLEDGVKLYKFEEEPEDIQIFNKGNGSWEVSGNTIFKIYHRYPISTDDNLLLFNEKLKKIGLYEKLREKNIQKGDIVQVFDYKMEWMD